MCLCFPAALSIMIQGQTKNKYMSVVTPRGCQTARVHLGDNGHPGDVFSSSENQMGIKDCLGELKYPVLETFGQCYVNSVE